MRISSGSTAFAVALLALAAPVEGQDRWLLELRGGPAFPTRDFGTEDLGNGVALEATLRYGFMPRMAGYVGWGWAHFNPETSFVGTDIDIEETGYVFGLRLHQRLGDEAPVVFWLRAGGAVAHLELEDAEGEIVGETDHGLGLDAAMGLAVELGPSLSLTPGIRFRSLSRDVETGTGTTPVGLRYVAVELGAALRF